MLTPELFIVPHATRPLLYAPLKGLVFGVRQQLIDRLGSARASAAPLESADPQLFALLDRLHLLDPVDAPTPEPVPPVVDGFEPIGVILLVTTACNLRCRYCYAEAGDRDEQKFDRAMAYSSVRLIVDNAMRLQEPTAYISFHGGGEPTTDFSFIQDVVRHAREYAQDKGGRVQVTTSLVTNGVIPPRRVDWIAENIDSVQVSLDGPPALHDGQRPTARGDGSHAAVVRTIHMLEGRVPDLLVKSTITRATVDKMDEIAEFMFSTFELRRFHFGPALSAGRGREGDHGEPQADDFVSGYYAAQRVADRYGGEIVVSGAMVAFPHVRATYCGVTDPNFALSVDGTISSCYEVIYDDDPRAPRFHYGRYDPTTKTFDVDSDKLRQLREMNVTKLSTCVDCFARWQCAGDCQARWYSSSDGSLESGTDVRCEVNRGLIADRLRACVAASDGVRQTLPTA